MKKFKQLKILSFLAILLGIAYYLHKQEEKFEFPESYEIANFPLYAQPDGVTCGPTSLKMILKYYGKDHTLEEIRNKTKTDFYVKDGVEIGGTTPEYMEIALNHFGVACYSETCDIDKLKWYVSQGRTPAVMVRSGKRLWHWVVVTGYTKYAIITADPSGGKREELPISIFKNAWDFTGDLHGRNVTTTCPVCEGDGLIVDWGPFGKCDVCGGDGKLPDLWWFLVELGEAKGNVLIVPKDRCY